MTTDVIKKSRFNWQGLLLKAKNVPTWVWFLGIGIVIATGYFPARSLMLSQDAWLKVIKTGSTVNFALFLFFVYNRLLNKGIKKIGLKVNSFLGLVLWLVGMAALIGALRLTGSFTTFFDAR